MQTSSNFFPKSLFGVEQQSGHRKKKDRDHQIHIVPDPLRSKEQLTPWTQINPKYNFNTSRLIKFKQKINQHPTPQSLQQQQRQVKSQMISNLFNFYKNNKEKKRSTLNMSRRVGKGKGNDINETEENGWTLPAIDDGNEELEEDLLADQAKGKGQQEEGVNAKEGKEDKVKDEKKVKTFIESISIREYLAKLKQKEKVIASPITEKPNNEQQHFISHRYTKNKTKLMTNNSINLVKQFKQSQQLASQRYAPVRNPQTIIVHNKRNNLSPLQSLQQSFQIYKKAAQIQVNDVFGGRKAGDLSSKGLTTLIGQKNMFKNNVPLSSLFSSPNFQTIKNSPTRNSIDLKNISPIKKYNTISYDKSFSPQKQKTLHLPKVTRNHSYHQ